MSTERPAGGRSGVPIQFPRRPESSPPRSANTRSSAALTVSLSSNGKAPSDCSRFPLAELPPVWMLNEAERHELEALAAKRNENQAELIRGLLLREIEQDKTGLRPSAEMVEITACRLLLVNRRRRPWLVLLPQQILR